MCAVVRTCQLFDITVKSGNQQRRHSSLLGQYGPPNAPDNTSPAVGSSLLGLPSCTALGQMYRGGRWFESTAAHH
ncbi:MAG TPA: hypothetical protein VKF28_08475, partial [Candidatus Dormibacteraeota bacterium]|nr:hypothetical protein [Candidatus Dormibacteraeota bacterium]